MSAIFVSLFPIMPAKAILEIYSEGCQLKKSNGRDVFDGFYPEYNWSAKDFELAKVLSYNSGMLL